MEKTCVLILDRGFGDALRKNPFVETTLSFALTYIYTVTSTNIDPATITILADDDYYSQTGAKAPGGPEGKSKFNDFGVPLSEAHKTGLGSSAALVTALTAALLKHYLPGDSFSLNSEQGRRRLHNLAQAAHCAAQGKVGSGFDVASAVYGSCVYRRFSPSLLQEYNEPGTVGFARHLQKLVEEADSSSKWDTEITKSAVSVPRGLRLVMCDVDCGSQTPGMVKKVLQWRKDQSEEAQKIWSRLQKKNEALASDLVHLAEIGSRDYDHLSDSFLQIRSLIREMSERSGVPIEPPEQTELIDACCTVPGVVGGVVPGAGGYDAIVLLIEDDPKVEESLRNFLTARAPEGEEASNPSKIGKVSILGVREDMIGVREEAGASYGEWLQ